MMVDRTIKGFSEYKNVLVDSYCLMPNHIHVILVIVGAGPCASPTKNGLDRFVPQTWGLVIQQGSTQGSTPTLGEYVKRFKTRTTFIYSKKVKNQNWVPYNRRIWQRNYYERIIRNEKELNDTREYIQNNPKNWESDAEKI